MTWVLLQQSRLPLAMVRTHHADDSECPPAAAPRRIVLPSVRLELTHNLTMPSRA